MVKYKLRQSWTRKKINMLYDLVSVTKVSSVTTVSEWNFMEEAKLDIR